MPSPPTGLPPKRKAESPPSPPPPSPRKLCAKDQLSALKCMTSVVADTGDFQKIKEFRPDDATTNPTLIFQAVQMPQYASLVGKAIAAAKSGGLKGEALVEEICDRLAVAFGAEILGVVSGFVSTEVDASLSFDTAKSVAKARKLIDMYAKAGFPKSRVLIKLASTWEGIKACKQLEASGIRCNMTLLFSFAQAVACAEAGAFLVSPFVGRILDWHKKASGKEEFEKEQDPGVLSVRRIYKYYKYHGYPTIVMGASFRNLDEILGLAGCDKLTIAPSFLEELRGRKGDVKRELEPEKAKRECQDTVKLKLDEHTFRWMHNEDAMATEKLAEGIRNFNKDLEKLKALIRTKLA